MKNFLQKTAKLTLMFGAIAFLAACSCGASREGEHHHKMKHHHHQAPEQEFVMMEMTEVVDMQMVENNIMKAKVYTRSNSGGVAEMGFVKFIQTDNGVKMSVNLKYLRPGVNYTLKLFKCGACDSDDCCAKTCMGVNLPMIMIEQSGQLKQTFNVRGINWNDLNNAKIVFMRDGGYKAAWGRFRPVTNF